MAALLTGLPSSVYSQKPRSIDGAVGFYPTDNLDGYGTGYVQLSYSWWVKKYIGLSAGGMFARSRINGTWNSGNVQYVLDNKIIELNAVGQVTFATLVFNRFGVSADLQFLFEPIPIDNISLEVHRGNEVSYKTSYRFTNLNPSGMLNAGVFYDAGKKENKVRFSLGYGIGYYDVYNTYRHTTIDGQNLSTHTPQNNRPISNIFFKISVFM